MIEAPAYPPALVARYRELGLWTEDTHAGLLERAAARFPTDLAVVDGELTLTYAQLRERVSARAELWRAQGVAPGDKVLLHFPNTAAFIEALFTAFWCGAVPVFALPAHREQELAYVAQASAASYLCTTRATGGVDFPAIAAAVAGRVGAKVLLVDGVGAAGAADSAGSADASAADAPAAVGTPPEPVAPTSLAFLQLSGGTTGNPKLIPRTHADYLYSVRESVRICDVRRGDRMLIVLPAAHNFTMSSPGILGAVYAGAAVVMAPDPSPGTCFGLIERWGITQVALVPPLAIAWVNSREPRGSRLGTLRTLWVGGAKLSDEIARRITPELGCALQQVYGMAEGLVNYTRLGDDIATIVSTQGRPISDYDELLIVDDDGRPVPAGAPGHLLTRGPYTIRGYYRAPEHNARSFTADGYFRTGDMVRVDPRGYITVVGRSKDIINRGGEKIAPEAVENALLSHPAVYDVSVVGTPDPVLGERTKALVILGEEQRDSPPRPVELKRYLRERGESPLLIPDVIEYVVEFATTYVGKVSKGAQR